LGIHHRNAITLTEWRRRSTVRLRPRGGGKRIPDEQWGEAVHAVVVPRAEVEEAELLGHCRALIAGYTVPKRIELRAEPLPKSAAGKILNRELRAPYWAGRETTVAGA
jgi:acyl-CoA synthetase (AMP-forming)/AMP-acid ligase II